MDDGLYARICDCKIFLYLGIGTFVWRNDSIFEFEYFDIQDV